MISDLIFINIIVVILIDILDIPTEFLFKPIWRLTTKLPYKGWSFKPFSCSLCTAWWLGLLYIIITHNFSILNIMIVLLLAVFNSVINDIINIVKEYWARLVNKILNIR